MNTKRGVEFTSATETEDSVLMLMSDVSQHLGFSAGRRTAGKTKPDVRPSTTQPLLLQLPSDCRSAPFIYSEEETLLKTALSFFFLINLRCEILIPRSALAI